MGSDEYVMVPREPTEEMLRAGLVGVEEPAAPLVGMRRLSNAYRAMLSAAPPSPRSDEGEGKPVAWLIGGENEGRGAFVTMSREVVDVAKARDLLIQPLFAAPPSPTPSGGPMALELQYRLAAPPSPRADDGEPYTVQCTDNGFLGDVLPVAAPPSPTPSVEVGELARLLNAAADAFEREAEDGFEAGERADLWDQVVEVPLKDVRTAASLLIALDAERGRMREALKPFARDADEWPRNADSDTLALTDPEGLASPYNITVGDLRRARSALPAAMTDTKTS